MTINHYNLLLYYRVKESQQAKYSIVILFIRIKSDKEEE